MRNLVAALFVHVEVRRRSKDLEGQALGLRPLGVPGP